MALGGEVLALGVTLGDEGFRETGPEALHLTLGQIRNIWGAWGGRETGDERERGDERETGDERK